jgi:Leucine-rich repeat (LRR) protein
MRPFLAWCALAVAVSANAAIPSSERDALAALYQSTNGAGWVSKTNWLGAAGTECTWAGVECDEAQAHVIGLYLYDNNLSGTLTPDLRKLTDLRQLQIWGNALQGTLPSQLSELSKLEAILAARNRLTGAIPREWGALKKLERLGLESNQLTGSIPSELGSLPELRELTLSDNGLTGSIPVQLGQLSNLENLSLNANRLTGSIPSQIGSLTKLQYLVLSDNQLSGPIPTSLGDLTSLIELYASYNQLTGGIPSAIGRLEKLEVLNLGVNPLGGPIPKELGGLRAIRLLDLREARLTGTIPAEIWTLGTVEQLVLGSNELTGPLPSSFAGLTAIRELDLYFNQLTGPVPPTLGDLQTLESLDLQGNRLTGGIPADLGRLPKLISLRLSENQLTGAIPPQLGSLRALETFAVNGNALEGVIPPEIGNLTALKILALDSNRLAGPIPESFRPLVNLEQFSANDNQLDGAIPSWIGEWTKLETIFLGRNRFTGQLPAGLSSLVNLRYLDVADNRLNGALPDLARMTALVYINAVYNDFTGPLPAGLGTLGDLETLAVGNNSLTGPLPRELGNLKKLVYVDLSHNSFEGTIPPEIGGLTSVQALSLYGNRLTGAIPESIGQLASVQYLDLSFNALRGAVPKAITSLTTLVKGGAGFGYNGLFTDDPQVRAFLNEKDDSGEFGETQTVTPANVRVLEVTDRRATLTWTPIAYQYDPGGYQVIATPAGGGAPVIAMTSTKEIDTITVRNLQSARQYVFTVTAITHPHDPQKNVIVSDPTPGVSATTRQRVVSPADVDVSDQPEGMVQIDGTEVVADSFTVANFGDVQTTITLVRGDPVFFTVTPDTFVLGPGKSQRVELRSQQRPAGSYWGYVGITGDGAPDDLAVYPVLLSTTRPAGTVVAQPIATTVEVAGAPGSDSVGVAQFRNTGTAALSGIVLSDQPWIEPDRQPITIEPGTVGTVNFRVLRSRRPAGEGTLVANLRLVYVNGGTFAGGVRVLGDPPPPGVSVSIVTVVDTTRPPVTTGSLPGVASGELAFFIPGIRSTATTRSDLSLLNMLGGRSISDLRLYFTKGGTTQIAALQPLEAARALSLVNLVGSIYATEGSGSLQVRTADYEAVSADAKVSLVTPTGTQGGALPVFRGDRSIITGQSLYLTGLSSPGDLLIQETNGAAATVQIDMVGATGTVLGTRDVSLTAYELVELNEVIPAGAVTAILTSTSGVLTAYGRLRDASGDVWSVVDWSRYYSYERTEAVRVPFADGRSESGGGRRRTVRHATTARFSTTLALFNPSTEEVTRARVDVVETSGRTTSQEVELAPRATMTLSNAGGSAGTPTAHLVVTPLRGEIVASARSRGSKGGTSVPVLSATAGLRLGQQRAFTALEDSATAQTAYGFVETSGASATIRARILIDGGAGSLVTAVTERDYEIGASQQIFVAELVRSFAGAGRDALGDFRNLVLEIEVVGGSGSIVPFVLATDVGTEDTSLMVQ